MPMGGCQMCLWRARFRGAAFNVFKHPQFFRPGTVNGDFSSALFGQVVKAAPPRLMQLALKYTC